MKYFLSLILILISAFGYAQKPIIKLNSQPDLFNVDKIGNIYVYHHQELKKYSSKGVLLGQYSNYNSGKLHSIDVTDPFKIMLFYRDFNQLTFLDNKLNPIGNPISINDLGFDFVLAVCKSKQMAVWLYESYQNKLIQYGFNPEGIINSINLNKLLPETATVSYMIEYGNKLFVLKDTGSIWEFDQYGGNVNELKINISGNFQIENNSLIYNNGYKLIYYSLLNHETSSLIISFLKGFDDAKISKQSIFLLKKNLIYIQKYEDAK